MSEDYEAICEQLNALTISYLSKMNDYSEHCKESSKCFQKGFVDLAHAKYAMGTQVISHYSYDKRMRANTILKIDEFEKISVVKTEIPHEAKKDTEAEGLRKRNTSPKENSDDQKLDEKKTAKEKKSKKNTTKDPLHWYGLFVSPSLRASQSSFKTVIEILVDQANTIGELKAMERQYRELLKRKQCSKQILECE